MTVAPDDIAATVGKRERQLLQRDIRNSRAALDGLLADDFVEVERSGFSYRRQDVIDALLKDPVDDVAVEDMECRQLSLSVVLLTYKSYRAGTATSDPRTTLRSSVWTLVEGDWKLRFHQGTPVPL